MSEDFALEGPIEGETPPFILSWPEDQIFEQLPFHHRHIDGERLRRPDAVYVPFSFLTLHTHTHTPKTRW